MTLLFMDEPIGLGNGYVLSELLGEITETLQDINTLVGVATEQSFALDELYPRSTPIEEDLSLLQEELDERDRWRTSVVEELQVQLRALIAAEVTAAIIKDEHMSENVRAEAMRTIKSETHAWIAQKLPLDLPKHVGESRNQLQQAKIGLANSQARSKNAFVENVDLDEDLAPLLTSDGQVSGVYPFNLRSLFAYDLESMQTLNKDYGLEAGETIASNLKIFLTHIGTRVQVYIPGEESVMSIIQ